jgi:hypothetical protein
VRMARYGLIIFHLLLARVVGVRGVSERYVRERGEMGDVSEALGIGNCDGCVVLDDGGDVMTKHFWGPYKQDE